MDGRIGGTPANGCHVVCHRFGCAMAAALRDRVTIDLRGIGNAVREAAKCRGATLAVFARQALVDAMGPRAAVATSLGFTPPGSALGTVKLTLRLSQPDAEAMILSAGALGLSYGEYVAKLVNGTPLPAPAAEREVDRAALLASTDHLSVIATDLHAFMRVLVKFDVRGMEPYRERMHLLDTDIRRHLALATTLMADAD